MRPPFVNDSLLEVFLDEGEKVIPGVRSCTMDIITRILTVATKPCIQNKIIHQCALSTVQWQKYRTLLMKAQLLAAQPAANPAKTLYQTTEKGKAFLKKYRELLTILV